MSEVSEGIFQEMQGATKNTKGSLDARKCKRKFTPVRESYSAEEVKKIRFNIGMTQSMFAGVIGVSPKTVESWEAGRYMPDGAARRLISILQMDPSFPEKYNIIRD